MLNRNITEMIDTLNTIISMQSGIINDLYMRLAQYESIEEMEKQSAAGVIAEAENLKKSIFDE